MKKNETTPKEKSRSRTPENKRNNTVTKATDVNIKGTTDNKANPDKKIGKSTGKKTIAKPKDPLADVKKEDLINKVKFYEGQILNEKEEKKKAIDNKNKEIQDKEKIIFSIAGTNKKLVSELEELRREVDEKLDKVGMKIMKDFEKEKDRDIKRRQAPLEQLIKVKEKELKNAMNLIEVFRKDNESMEKSLHEKGNLNEYLALQDKLKQEEMRNEQLVSEYKILCKVKDEHGKCILGRKGVDKEKAQLMNEIKQMKLENKELKVKFQIFAEKEKNDKNANNKEKSSFLPNINSYINNNKEENKPRPLADVNSSQDMKKYWKMLENIDRKSKDDSSVLNWKNLYTSNSPNNSPKLGAKASSNNNINSSPTTNNKPIRKNWFKSNYDNPSNKHKFAVSLQSRLNIQDSETENKLISQEEKEILTKLIPPKQIAKLEKKFETADQAKQALENKYYSETKVLNKRVSELESRLEMTSLNIKEIDQKNKILQFQINEHKHEGKILSKKINDLNGNYKEVNGKLKEKLVENKNLLNQLEEMYKKLEEELNKRQERKRRAQEGEEENEDEEEEQEGEDEEEEQEEDD